jgi:hypothetical protein
MSTTLDFSDIVKIRLTIDQSLVLVVHSTPSSTFDEQSVGQHAVFRM